jgi:hypothetical protein
LACKVVVTTGDGRTLIGKLKRQNLRRPSGAEIAGGRLLAAPQVFCTCCVVPALLREIEAHQWLRQSADPVDLLGPYGPDR